MNYTENYHLPQWEETDRIMRTDFNQMCADMEEGLNANAQAAALAGKVTYAAGYYRGLGEEFKIVTGFKPKMLLIHGVRTGTQAQDNALSVFFLNAPSQYIVSYTDDGFILRAHTAGRYPHINIEDTPYAYVAFR